MEPLRIEVLLRDPSDRLVIDHALNSTRYRWHRGAPLPKVYRYSSWERFLDQAGGEYSVPVVDPSVGQDDEQISSGLVTFIEMCGVERIVLFVDVQYLKTPAFQWLRAMGLSLIIERGMADDRDTVLELLARSTTAGHLAATVRHLADSLGDDARMLLSGILTAGYTHWEVPEAAAMLSMSERALVRRCNELGLPPPGSLLVWGRLFRAVALYSLGVATPFRLARRVGYGDPRSLYRLTRRVLETTLGELLAEPDPASLMVERFRRAMHR